MNRVQQVRNKFPDFADLAIQIADPSHNNKYLLWIATQLSKNHKREDIVPTITAFHKGCKRLSCQDIYRYTDLKDLENEIKDLELSNRQVEILSKEGGSLKLYEDDNYTLIRINSKSAIIYYGMETRWCITQEDHTYWEDYSSNGNVFYVLIDKKYNCKYAVQKEGLVSITIWEENDDEVDDINYWINNHKHLEEAIFKCLQDREPSMLFQMRARKVSKKDVSEWLKYQHNCTIKYITRSSDVVYLVDVSTKVDLNLIKTISKILTVDFDIIQKESQQFIDNVAKFLAKTKGHKMLKSKIAKFIDNPEILLDEEDVAFAKIDSDEKIAKGLLSNPNAKVWKKALGKARTRDIVSTLPQVTGTKKRIFVEKIKSKTNFYDVLSWLTTQPDIVPKNIWPA